MTFEVALRWEGWYFYEGLKIELDQPVAGSTTSITEKDWKGTYSANIGAKYQLTESVALLAGYLYGGTLYQIRHLNLLYQMPIHIFLPRTQKAPPFRQGRKIYSKGGVKAPPAQSSHPTFAGCEVYTFLFRALFRGWCAVLVRIR